MMVGKQVGDKDEEFREKYSSFIGKQTGEDDLMLSLIDEKV